MFAIYNSQGWDPASRDSMDLKWQSVVNGRRVRVCVGVVELPAGPGLSTDRLFTHRLSIPELGSTRSPLIFVSPCKQRKGGRRDRRGIREPLWFIIMK